MTIDKKKIAGIVLAILAGLAALSGSPGTGLSRRRKRRYSR